MSYVQGTIVRVIGEFRSLDTEVLEDPEDVVVSVWSPDGSATDVRKLSDNSGVEQLETGIYQTLVDTEPAPGEWTYTFESTGSSAVVKRGKLRVRPRPAVVA